MVKSIPGYGVTRLLLVTDTEIVKLGLHHTCLATMENIGLNVVIYDKIEPDPTQGQIEQGVVLLNEHGCDGVLGFGGGSSIDAAKLIATRGTNQKSIDKMEGPFTRFLDGQSRTQLIM